VALALLVVWAIKVILCFSFKFTSDELEWILPVCVVGLLALLIVAITFVSCRDVQPKAHRPILHEANGDTRLASSQLFIAGMSGLIASILIFYLSVTLDPGAHTSAWLLLGGSSLLVMHFALDYPHTRPALVVGVLVALVGCGLLYLYILPFIRWSGAHGAPA
jgi:hypothetical protein